MSRFGLVKWLMVGVVAVMIITACGGEPGAQENNESQAKKGAILLDSPLVGVTYECTEPHVTKKTDAEGRFECDEAPVTFRIGGLVLGRINDLNSSIVFPQDILGLRRDDIDHPKLIALLRLLQSIDDDGDINTTIIITAEMSAKFETVNEKFDADHLNDYADIAGPVVLVTEAEAKAHFVQAMKNAILSLPGGHSLDGKTIYMTECRYYRSSLGVDDDGIYGIQEGDIGGGVETIFTLKFENGFWVAMGGVGSPMVDFGGGDLPKYRMDSSGFWIYHARARPEDNYSLIRLYGNYFADLGGMGSDEPWKIISIFDTADAARAYIRKVYTKEQRSCMVD